MAKEKNTDIFFFQPNPLYHLDSGQIEIFWRDLFNIKFNIFGQVFFRGRIALHGVGRKSKHYQISRQPSPLIGWGKDQGLKSHVSPAVIRKSGAALFIPISTPTSIVRLSLERWFFGRGIV